MGYAREHIERLAPYVPGEQPSDTQVVKLNTNENPFPPADGVIEAIQRITPELLRRYPSPGAATFREVAAETHRLSPENVIATNGGDELLRLAITAFCDPAGDGWPGGLGETMPTYSLYDVLAAIHHTPVTRVPLLPDWSIPEDFADRLNHAGCRLAIVVNPHAPSGRAEPIETLDAMARAFDGVLLVDEAYVDFADDDALALLDADRGLDNVLLLRSLSKGYSLAGLRFGYGLGPEELIATLHKVRDSYNVDAIAQVAAVAALRCRGQAAETWRRVRLERARVEEALRQRGFELSPSSSNFLLAGVPRALGDARSLYQSLKRRSIFVRYFEQDRLRDKLRITIGTPEQNDTLLAALDGMAPS